MENAVNWFVPMLAAVVLLAGVGVLLLVREWPRTAALSPDERDEMADAPMPSLQKRAWWSLALGVAGLGSITALIVSKGGAAVYWVDDDLRLVVIGIFIATLLAHTFVLLVPNAVGREGGRFDERAERVLMRASTAQPVAMILALAAWEITLAQRFHDEGAVPVVYLYLIFGSILLVSFLGQSIGVLLGYWFGAKHGEG